MRRLRHGDEGVVTSLIAILLGTGVLLGFGVLVIDVGQIYGERRQLQNGADAASLAVAATCILDSSCDPDEAGPYADSNANDLVTALDGSYGPAVCGRGPGLPICELGPGGYTDCAVVPTSPTKYVQVRTRTEQPGGSSLVPAALARTLPGMGGYDGKMVRACARATYGPPGGLVSMLPITISLCEWEFMTTAGADFAPPPPYPPYPESGHNVLYYHSPKKAGLDGACPAGPPGSDAPGDFGWLKDNSSVPCAVETNADGWVPADPGSSPGGTECTPGYVASMHEKVIYIPIYDITNGETGANLEYHIHGYAAFYLAGYNLGGLYHEDDAYLGKRPCNGEDRCMSGWFTQGLVPTLPTGGGGTASPDMGAYVTYLIP